MPRDLRKADCDRLRPEQPHWPLVVMTVLTQLSVGGFAFIWLVEMLGVRVHRFAAIGILGIAAIALAASTLHLGRPIHAIRALKMWRRSWLSREVLLFTLFAGAAAWYSTALWFAHPLSPLLGGATALFGLAGVTASAKLYMVPGRPAWNTPFTFTEFFLTMALLGSAAVVVLGGNATWARLAAIVAAFAVFMHGGARMLWLFAPRPPELRGTARLLSTVLARQLFWRYLLLGAGLALLALAHSETTGILAVLLFASAEFLGRYLFFVSVVPKNMAAEYLAFEEAA